MWAVSSLKSFSITFVLHLTQLHLYNFITFYMSLYSIQFHMSFMVNNFQLYLYNWNETEKWTSTKFSDDVPPVRPISSISLRCRWPKLTVNENDIIRIWFTKLRSRRRLSSWATNNFWYTILILIVMKESQGRNFWLVILHGVTVMWVWQKYLRTVHFNAAAPCSIQHKRTKLLTVVI